jgi:hypothetical protein
MAGTPSVPTEDGEVHLVAFFSRTLSGAEPNYDTHGQGQLAIFEALKTWRHYLKSLHHTIDVITDHESGVLLFDKDAYASSSSLVGSPPRL